MFSIMLDHMMVSSWSEGDANADGVIIFSIGTTQPTIVEKLKPPTSWIWHVSIDLQGYTYN